MNREQRRLKHKLIEVPKGVIIPGISFAGETKRWACTCKADFLVISNNRPTEAHLDHVKNFGKNVYSKSGPERPMRGKIMKTNCKSKEHNPPKKKLGLGWWEHECHECGQKQIFEIRRAI